MLPPPVIELIVTVLGLLRFAILVWVIMSLLINFDIINRRQELVRVVFNFLEQLLRPMLTPIQRLIPVIGGFDLSPVVLLLAIQFTQSMVIYYLA